MDCDKIKELIPAYFNHKASEEEVKMVEEHLCICHQCRTLLGQLMDSDAPDEGFKPDPKDDQQKKGPQADEEKPLSEKDSAGIEYIPAKNFEELLKKPPEPPVDLSGIVPPAADEASGKDNSTSGPAQEGGEEPSDIEYVSDLNQDGPIQSSQPEPGGIDQAYPLDSEAPISGLDDEPSKKPPSEDKPAKEPQAEDESEQPSSKQGGKVIQTPLGPITLNDDDQPEDVSEIEDKLPDLDVSPQKPQADDEPKQPSSKQEGKVIQTPLGPITLDDDIDVSEDSGATGGSPDLTQEDHAGSPSSDVDDKQILSDSAADTPPGEDNPALPEQPVKETVKPRGEDERQPAVSREDTPAGPEGLKPAAPPSDDKSQAVSNHEPMYSGEHSDMSNDTPDFELDQNPIVPDKTGFLNNLIVAVAIIMLIVVAYLLFTQIKG
jgi:hypothetical protein